MNYQCQEVCARQYGLMLSKKGNDNERRRAEVWDLVVNGWAKYKEAVSFSPECRELKQPYTFLCLTFVRFIQYPGIGHNDLFFQATLFMDNHPDETVPNIRVISEGGDPDEFIS